MQRISTIIVFVGAVLVGQTMAAPSASSFGDAMRFAAGAVDDFMDGFYQVPRKPSLIPHPEQEELLNEKKLVENLSLDHLSGKSDEEKMKYVAHQLYRANNKAQMEVCHGLTVAELINLNHMDINDCSPAALESREPTYEKATAGSKTYKYDVTWGIEEYAEGLRKLSLKYCIDHKDEVIAAGIRKESSFDDLLKDYMGSTDFLRNPKEGLFVARNYMNNFFKSKGWQ